MADSGGYEEGYAACCCFWGRDPGSLVTRLLGKLPDVTAFMYLTLDAARARTRMPSQKGALR